MQEIRSTIAVHGKYHAFRLAEGLNTRGVLDKIYTLYPKFRLSYNLPASKIKSFWFIGALKFINNSLGKPFSDHRITYLFDYLVSLYLKKPASNWIFNGYSGYTLNSLKKAKELGAITLVERACPHIDFQVALVAEEKELLLGKPPALVSKDQQDVYLRMKREYEIADYVVVPSNYSAKSFLDKGFSKSKIIIIPLCNEKDIVHAPKQSENKDQFRVLCIGGNFYRKGIVYLLQAWKKLNLQNAKLIIKNDIPEEFRSLANIPSVEIIDKYLSEKEMSELYNEVDIFILPSIDDGFGMVVVEAMAAGLPVIITQNVGAADIMEDGKEGFIIPIRDSKAIAEKLMFFYKNREVISEMGKHGMEIAKEYTPQKYAERMIKEYEKIFSQ